MRKIKFRAWSKQHKTMFDISYLRYNGDQTLREVGHALGSTRNVIHVANNYILMQWTGLKDVNGEEIYEGDIVECFVNGNSYVSFKGGAYGLIFDYSFIPFSDVYGEMKVIGNIYEHPHLLKEVKND